MIRNREYLVRVLLFRLLGATIIPGAITGFASARTFGTRICYSPRLTKACSATRSFSVVFFALVLSTFSNALSSNCQVYA
jgi:hypothetical protein